MRTPPILALVLLGALAVPAQTATSTSNLEREKNWADQIVDALIAGEPVTLEARGVKFLGLHTEPANSEKSPKAVILLHGRGVHPAWGFIDTLRVDLADAGWHTLSLQMPILDADVKLSEYGATLPEAFDRIDAGIRFLQARGIRTIVLAGHSSGAMTALAYAAERPTASIAAVGAISPPTEPAGGRLMKPVELLPHINKPVLDIYGSDDFPEIRSTAKARRAAAGKAGNRDYAQQLVKGANHFYTDRYDALKQNLLAWLARFGGK
ncbi:phospholipase [Sulfurifustis variabilis]|uniref:Phospholipase n=1 Tax=Sulfurifustis variabilis TaxID=1675686 RepID=A0A1C7AFA7_9GAMM|nr:alpha/beta fold hydrolase [Sulfurifustis variabilis]BAU49963.1 phospholipase [Sulfurifustis variabilis]